MEQDYNSDLLEQMENRLKNDPEARARVEGLFQAASGTGHQPHSTPGILYSSAGRRTIQPS